MGGSVTGTINPVGEADWFRVELVAGKRYQIDLEGAPTDRGTLPDPHLFNLYNAAATEISGTGNGNGGVGVNARVIFTPTVDGTYFVRAAAWLLATGTYTLSVIELGANGVSEADTDFPITTPPPAGSTSVARPRATSVLAAITTGSRRIWRRAKDTRSTWRDSLPAAAVWRIDPWLFSIYDADGSDFDTDNDDIDGEFRQLNSRVIFTPMRPAPTTWVV